MSELIRGARLFAMGAHSQQKRRFTNEPYFFHCEEVANLVEQYGGSEAMIAAAWLHDVMEDCGVRLETLCEEFGAQVGDYVWWLTKRKGEPFFLKPGADIRTIKLADVFSNISTVEARDAKFASRYLAEKRDILPMLEGGHPELFARVSKIIEDYFARHSQAPSELDR